MTRTSTVTKTTRQPGPVLVEKPAIVAEPQLPQETSFLLFSCAWFVLLMLIALAAIGGVLLHRMRFW